MSQPRFVPLERNDLAKLMQAAEAAQDVSIHLQEMIWEDSISRRCIPKR